MEDPVDQKGGTFRVEKISNLKTLYCLEGVSVKLVYILQEAGIQVLLFAVALLLSISLSY